MIGLIRSKVNGPLSATGDARRKEDKPRGLLHRLVADNPQNIDPCKVWNAYAIEKGLDGLPHKGVSSVIPDAKE